MLRGIQVVDLNNVFVLLQFLAVLRILFDYFVQTCECLLSRFIEDALCTFLLRLRELKHFNKQFNALLEQSEVVLRIRLDHFRVQQLHQ